MGVQKIEFDKEALEAIELLLEKGYNADQVLKYMLETDMKNNADCMEAN